MQAFERYDRTFPVEPMNPDMVVEPTSWLVPGFIMEAKINLIVGAEKSGKSRLFSWLLAHMMCDSSTFGLHCRAPQRILYLLGEETQGILIERLRADCLLAGLPYDQVDWPARLHFIDAAGMRLDQKQQRQWMAKHLDNYDMLIIDPLRRVHGGAESSNDEMSLIFNDLRNWTNQLGLTLLMIHHTGKLGPDDDEGRIATWCRGATDLPAVLDWAIYLRRTASQSDYRPDSVKIRRQGRAVPLEPLVLYDHRGQPPGWHPYAHKLQPDETMQIDKETGEISPELIPNQDPAHEDQA